MRVWIIIIIFGLLFLSEAQALTGFGPISPFWGPGIFSFASIANITPVEVNKLIRKDKAVLVDVREWNEVEQGMAEPARWMPLSRMTWGDHMFSDFLETLPKNKLIVLYCEKGLRACKGQSELEIRGYHTANMGGFSEWLKAGLPVRHPGQ